MSKVLNDLKSSLGLGHLSHVQRKNLYRGMASRLNQGLSAVSAWEAICKTTERRLNKKSMVERYLNANRKMVTALSVAITRAKNGHQIEDCLAGFIPVTDMITLRAGRVSNRLGPTCETLRANLDRESTIVGAVRSAVVYPLLLIAMLCGLVYLYGIVLFPTLGGLVPIERWPQNARRVVALAQFGASWWPLILAAVAAAAAILGVALAKYTGAYRAALDSIFPFNLYRITQGTTFVEALRTLVESGVELPQAIVHLRDAGSLYFRSRVSAISQQLDRGNVASLPDAMDATGHAWPDETYIDALATSGDAGDLARQIGPVNADWISATTKDVERKSKIIFYVGLLTVLICIFALLDAVYALVGRIQTL